jgi:hypothetical protein
MVKPGAMSPAIMFKAINTKGLTPHDLIDIAMCNQILYDGAKQTGVMFHMIGALSEFGKPWNGLHW